MRRGDQVHLISIVISLLIFMIDVQFEVTCFGPPSSTLSTCPYLANCFETFYCSERIKACVSEPIYCSSGPFKIYIYKPIWGMEIVMLLLNIGLELDTRNVEQTKDVRMYIEEFILVDIWIHCCTKLKS